MVVLVVVLVVVGVEVVEVSGLNPDVVVVRVEGRAPSGNCGTGGNVRGTVVGLVVVVVEVVVKFLQGNNVEFR